MSNDKKQVAGDHYLKMQIQPFDIIDGWPVDQARAFYRGSALKYIMRAGSKGPAKEDYEKAEHYLEKLVSTYE